MPGTGTHAPAHALFVRLAHSLMCAIAMVALFVLLAAVGWRT